MSPWLQPRPGLLRMGFFFLCSKAKAANAANFLKPTLPGLWARPPHPPQVWDANWGCQPIIMTHQEQGILGNERPCVLSCGKAELEGEYSTSGSV